MRWISAVVLVFSTYSRIPVPQLKWDNKAMNIAIAFLPLVGVAVGGVVWCWQAICGVLGLSPVLFAAVAAALPIIITGGIHADGFCDTADALASWQTKERSLEILKDPRIGAFALIRFCIYLLLCFGLFYELYTREVCLWIGLLYPLSRCFAVWSAITIQKAGKTGMLAEFTDKADLRTVSVCLALLTVIAAAGWIWLTFPFGIAGLILCLPVSIWYKHTAKKRFGGVTGDTTGYYLQIIELALLAGLLIGSLVLEWL